MRELQAKVPGVQGPEGVEEAEEEADVVDEGFDETVAEEKAGEVEEGYDDVVEAAAGDVVDSEVAPVDVVVSTVEPEPLIVVVVVVVVVEDTVVVLVSVPFMILVAEGDEPVE